MMRATVKITDSREVVVTLIATDEEILVRGITVEFEDMPIMRMPFFTHGRRLHTTCRNMDDEIETMEL